MTRAARGCYTGRMSLAITVDQAQELLDRTPFTRELGLHVVSLADGECVLDIPFDPRTERPDHIINGGVYMTAADVTMWLAIMTRLGLAQRTVTTNMETAFLSAAIKENIRCTARVFKWGSRLVYGTAECANKSGKLLTHHTLTYIRL
ncbi:MAG: PaaI family thioesterase [Anaerolineae bacterium]